MSVGRLRNDKVSEDLVVRMVRENRSWGYDRIVGALTNLGSDLSDQAVGNIQTGDTRCGRGAHTRPVHWDQSTVCGALLSGFTIGTREEAKRQELKSAVCMSAHGWMIFWYKR